MLEQLVITDFAVARSVTIEFGPGLNVFTGETGAGKSLVVDALAFVFGGRRGREVIATGAERATVTAILSTPSGPLTLERTVGQNGRSTSRVDGTPAPLEDVRALGDALADIHGQSDQLAILRPAVQLELLDAFAGLRAQREAVTAQVRALRDIRREAATLASDARERERLLDQLRFEHDEIAAASLVEGEDVALRVEIGRLGNAARLIEDAERALEALDSAPLSEAESAVADIATRDDSAAPLAAMASGLTAAASDFVRELRHYREAIEQDPARLAQLQERLDRIARLCRKYGDTVAHVISYGENAAARLANLSSAETSLAALHEREHAVLEDLGARAQVLSLARRAAAGELVRAISRELEHLGMAPATLAVGFSCEDAADGPAVALPDYEVAGGPAGPAATAETHTRAFTESGVDRIEFLASFNSGEAARPLATVASGGETSRFLLALTTVFGSASAGRTVVLDEVDEGVGGRAGALVGDALQRLAAHNQVLCITHLPQVAAYGDRHFVVSKESDGGRTWSEVRPVEALERLDELAAMLGGRTDANRAAARDLLAAARPGGVAILAP